MKRLITILLLITFIFPIFIILCYSICTKWVYPELVPSNLTLRGVEVFFSMESFEVTINSIKYAVLTTVFTIILCIPASRALACYNFKGKQAFKMLITSPLILPLASITMGIHILFIKLGITNTVLGVVMINCIPCIPYAVRLISNIMLIVGIDYEMVAKNLGASKSKAFFKITFPMIAPGIISAFSFVFIVAFSQYFTTFLIGGGIIKTLPMLLIPYIQSGDRTLAAVYSILFIISALLVLIVMELLMKKHYAKWFYINNNM